MIDWQNVAKAISFYGQRGYQLLEVPWIVSSEAIEVTLPKGREAVSTRYGDLVGSAEQSFIQDIILSGRAPEGKYMAATPCFRDDELDDLHQRHFFKVELIQIYSHVEWACDQPWPMVAADVTTQDAWDFFHSLLGYRANSGLARVRARDICDITLNGIEIGSYGIREYKGWTWVYGTGYADPRFTRASR